MAFSDAVALVGKRFNLKPDEASFELRAAIANGDVDSRDVRWLGVPLTNVSAATPSDDFKEVDRTELLPWLATVSRPEGSKTQLPPGRKRIYDWEGSMLQLAILERESGTENKTQAEMVTYLQDWFIATTGDSPSSSLIKERVRRWQSTHSQK